jgi:hypothetical protein
MDSSANTSPIAVFCKELRDARRYRQITLAEVAETTRISPEFLDALESGRWDDVPRAYLRGYLVLYASAVGMNREKVLRSFDRLVSPAMPSASVEFDDTPRALRQPQEVGVTRAKIRVSWFAQLSRNRRALYMLTLIVVIILAAILRLSRKPQEPSVAVNSFAETLTEDHENVHGPFTIVPLDADTLASRSKMFRSSSAMIMGLQKTQLTIRRAADRGIRLRIAAFDTVAVPFTEDLTISTRPSGTVRVRVDSVFVTPEKSAASGEDVFLLQIGHSQPVKIEGRL